MWVSARLALVTRVPQAVLLREWTPRHPPWTVMKNNGGGVRGDRGGGGGRLTSSEGWAMKDFMYNCICRHCRYYCTLTGDHSKQDQILLVKTGEHIDFCVYRRSYSLWPPVIYTWYTVLSYTTPHEPTLLQTNTTAVHYTTKRYTTSHLTALLIVH